MVTLLTFSPSALASGETDTNELELDLDIRVVEYPSEVSRTTGGSDYLTCKTDSTCDDSNAC